MSQYDSKNKKENLGNTLETCSRLKGIICHKIALMLKCGGEIWSYVTADPKSHGN
jgi:hypothetical protein